MKESPSQKVSGIAWLAIMLIPTIMFGLLGAIIGFLDDPSKILIGFIWGFGVVAVLMAFGILATFGWEWIKEQANQGKLLPYVLVGAMVAVAVCGYLALNLGSPSCDEYGEAPYNSCLSYGDDGFKATGKQQWGKFLSSLPTFMIISVLIAVIVHSYRHPKK